MRRIDDEKCPVDPADGELATAATGLRALPLSAGEHPFLDEITVTVEAARQAIAALASVAGGEEVFAGVRADR